MKTVDILQSILFSIKELQNFENKLDSQEYSDIRTQLAQINDQLDSIVYFLGE